MWSLVCAESILATRKLEENCVVHLPLHSCMEWLHGKWLFNHSMQCLTKHVAFFCVAWHCVTEALCGMVSSISTTNLKKDTFFNAFIMKMSAVNWSWNTLVTCLLATNWIYLAQKSKLYIKIIHIINRLLCFCLLLSDGIYPLKLSILARLGWLPLTCLSDSELTASEHSFPVLQVPESNFRPSEWHNF